MRWEMSKEVLINAISDVWYDVWKEMDGPITFSRDYPGYYEVEVEEQIL